MLVFWKILTTYSKDDPQFQIYWQTSTLSYLETSKVMNLFWNLHCTKNEVFHEEFMH